MSETAQNLKKVAIIFFIVLGLGHILSGLMVSNGYWLPWSAVINRILSIPFAMSALIYGLTGISTQLKEGHQKLANTLFIGLTLFIFIALTYITIFIPDRPL